MNFYRKLSELRRNPEFQDTLTYGKTEAYMEDEKGLMAYFRRGLKQDILVAGNFLGTTKTIEISEMLTKSEKILLSNDDVELQENQLVLKPYQVVVLSLS